MATIRSFEDIEAWQLARELAKEIYELTLTGTFSKDYSLKDQINKSTGSTMDNIAEGFDRGGNKEFVQFLSIAKGSSAEVRSQLYRALDRNHITKDQLEYFNGKAFIVSKKIGGLMNYLLGSDLKGMKYSEPQEPYSNHIEL